MAVTLDDALDGLFESDVDQGCGERSLILDEATRSLLLRKVSQAVRFAAERLLRNIAGDRTPDPATNRFPVYEPPKVKAEVAPTRQQRVEAVGDLFNMWKAYAADKVAASMLAQREGTSRSV